MFKDHQLKIHSPVLLTEVLTYLAPEKGETYLDVTAGYGGHAARILEKTSQDEGSVLIDRDITAINELHKRFNKREVELIHNNFASASKILHQAGKKFNLILADLGVSSPHLGNASRGFSFQYEGPLDMRMDANSGQTAAEIVNTYSEERLVEILHLYGEEPRARRIAHAIILARPITSTTMLANIVAQVYRGRGKYKTHPATKTFQALRIAVNDELGQITEALPLWLDMLLPQGRIAIISFHSLEDRIVKQFLSERGGERYDADIRILTKKPVTSSNDELVSNPRARSAKLRVAVKK